MDKQSAIRRVRIAVSVFFGVLAVALCVLWAMSYRWLWVCEGPVLRTNAFALYAIDGTTIAHLNPFEGQMRWMSALLENKEATVGKPPGNPFVTFRAERALGGYHLQLPIWFSATAAAALAATPWLKRRFSLRSLLIAMTLVAAVLGLFCYAVR